jgi:deoxyhypusine synthase
VDGSGRGSKTLIVHRLVCAVAARESAAANQPAGHVPRRRRAERRRIAAARSKAGPRPRVRARPQNQQYNAGSMAPGPISQFVDRHYRHFNAAALKDAAEAWTRHLDGGGVMFLTLAGAMSTAELGVSLAEMIRQGKVHAICCTGANLEEDVFNLVAHSHYERLPNYRDLTPADEQKLLERHMNRVTDTCIPEHEAMRRIETAVLEEWVAADQAGERYFPHEFLYRVLRSGKLQASYEIDPKDSWLMAAMERNLPMFVPGWEDATLGNMYAGHVITGDVKSVHTVRTGIEYMTALADWYQKTSPPHSIGFFQIGGGIAGDFPICVVPMLHQDLQRPDVPLWGYFCQISDSTTSYGSYSGAVPNEKITWGKLGIDTPKYIIESDATIVAPLVFAKVLGW